MLELFIDINRSLSSALRPHLADVSLALVATILVIYGDYVNGTLKKAVSNWVFVARVAAFILMCTFGYGLITFWTQPAVHWLLLQTPYEYRPAAVVFAFCMLGILAERKRHL